MLADFPTYGQWSNFSKIDGVAQVGTKLAMKMPGMSLGSTVTAAAHEQKLEWAAKIFSKNFSRPAYLHPDVQPRRLNAHRQYRDVLGGLVWPLQGMFKQSEGRWASGYDGLNEALKQRVEANSVAS